jgi:hypothetical protein
MALLFIRRWGIKWSHVRNNLDPQLGNKLTPLPRNKVVRFTFLLGNYLDLDKKKTVNICRELIYFNKNIAEKSEEKGSHARKITRSKPRKFSISRSKRAIESKGAIVSIGR